MTNLEIAKLLRNVAAAYLILGENRFKIIAYERAADSIEHLTSEVKDYWDNDKLKEIPGVGAGIAQNLDELFRHGTSTYWKQVLEKIPEAIFPLMQLPGLGPKKAYILTKQLALTSKKTAIEDLEKAAQAGKIAEIEGFGEQSQSAIVSSIQTYKRGAIKENRMPLPHADAIAQEVITYLIKEKSVERADVLGSLRRQVSTIGDVDIAVATNQPEVVLDHFITFPHQKIIDRGPAGATLLLHSGRQVDLRVQKPDSYGAMLQYFTGSKNHNISLRELALGKGMSLSEYGIKDINSGKLKKYATEDAFYNAIGLPYIAPELREDQGEIEAGKTNALPIIVEVSDIKGDLHIHSDYDLHPSHDYGKDSIADLLTKASKLGYEYVGFSDHNPKVSGQTKNQIIDIMKRRKQNYEQQYTSWKRVVKGRVQYFLMCEVDISPDGTLALPEQAFDYVDAVIVSIHSVFNQPRLQMTDRLIRAMTAHPKVRILGHPTGRLLGKREGVDADWSKIFETAKLHDIALEINAYPERLDLPDSMVHHARKEGNKFCIDTDSHAVEQMDLIRYGVSVARRGWCSKRDIVNSMGYTKFRNWLLRKE